MDMSDFWIGYLSCIVTYFAIGLVVGIAMVGTHLAYFFSAGWQVKRMLQCIVANAIAWPATVGDLFTGG